MRQEFLRGTGKSEIAKDKVPLWTERLVGNFLNIAEGLRDRPTQPMKPPKYFASWPAHSFLCKLSLWWLHLPAGTTSWAAVHTTLSIPLYLFPRYCHKLEHTFPLPDALTHVCLPFKGLIRHHVCERSFPWSSSLQSCNFPFYIPSRLPLVYASSYLGLV